MNKIIMCEACLDFLERYLEVHIGASKCEMCGVYRVACFNCGQKSLNETCDCCGVGE